MLKIEVRIPQGKPKKTLTDVRWQRSLENYDVSQRLEDPNYVKRAQIIQQIVGAMFNED